MDHQKKLWLEETHLKHHPDRFADLKQEIEEEIAVANMEEEIEEEMLESEAESKTLHKEKRKRLKHIDKQFKNPLNGLGE